MLAVDHQVADRRAESGVQGPGPTYERMESLHDEARAWCAGIIGALVEQGRAPMYPGDVEYDDAAARPPGAQHPDGARHVWHEGVVENDDVDRLGAPPWSTQIMSVRACDPHVGRGGHR